MNLLPDLIQDGLLRQPGEAGFVESVLSELGTLGESVVLLDLLQQTPVRQGIPIL
jgi:hypothetical protein